MMPNLMFTIHFKFGFHDGCRVMLYCVCVFLSPMLTVSLDCSFLIVLSVLSNIY